MAASFPFKRPFDKHDSERYALVNTEPSLTHQCFQDECDINTILDRWQKTGVLEHENKFHGQYGDFISAQDYHASLNAVLEADEAFSTLPSSIRARFENDPAAFLDFVNNPSNRDEMIQMGLLQEPVVPAYVEDELAKDVPVSDA